VGPVQPWPPHWAQWAASDVEAAEVEVLVEVVLEARVLVLVLVEPLEPLPAIRV
jgi:hypothetical protein